MMYLPSNIVPIGNAVGYLLSPPAFNITAERADGFAYFRKALDA
jgi:hypothetical protein